MLKIGLVGRTNVGKSTLFNRLLWTFRAIVADIAWTTRELLHEEGKVRDIPVIFVDSPGLADFEQEVVFLKEIIDTADIILFVGDGKQGITSQEEKIAALIFSAGKKDKTLVAVNKMDKKVWSSAGDMILAERYQLGFSDVYGLSAQQYEGVEEFRDTLYERLQGIQYAQERVWIVEDNSSTKDTDLPLVIVGRPNVGKSTLLNTLIGEEIAQVSPIAGTTLDYIKAPLAFHGHTIMLYDTAGIRKKGKIHNLERIAYEKTQALISFVKPVVIMVIDMVEGVTQRDKSLLGELLELGTPMIIAANKIDTFPREEQEKAIKRVQRFMPCPWVPFVGISAEKGFGVPQLMQHVIKVTEAAKRRVNTAQLNKVLQDARLLSPPRFPKNKICKRKYVTQVDTIPPTFMLSVNNEEYANFAFQNRCENIIRKKFWFSGVPIRLVFRGKSAQNPFATGSYVGKSEEVVE